MRVPDGGRPPTAPRSRPRTRGLLWALGIFVAVVFVLLLSLRGIAGLYTDKLWFDTLGQGDTWRRLLLARIIPAAAFTAAFFVLMWVNLLLADRLAPTYRGLGTSDEIIERFQQVTARYAGRIRLGVAFFFALVAGVGVSAQWQQWILFTNRVDFGIKDPQFHKDVGFYVFQLPFLEFIVDWLFAGLLIVLLVTAVAHYLNGGIRFQGPFQRVTPQVKAHLSVILALMALVKTASYYLDQFALNFSTRGDVQGAGATDVNAQLPALKMLMVISVVAAGLFVWNIFRRGWVLPVIAVGLWAFVAVIIGTIYPAYYQRFKVNPNQLAKEQPYIGRNIEGTRDAFGIADVSQEAFPYTEDLTPEAVVADQQSLRNARLWDPPVTRSAYQTLQGFQTYYRIDDVDVDRYIVEGELDPTIIAARELNAAELPSQSWVNRHIVYTHGYSVVASPSNRSDPDGAPQYFTSQVPVKNNGITVDRPEVYLGQGLSGFALINAKQDEVNYARQDSPDVTTRYEGKDGVALSSPLRRAAFALRFGDVNLLISGQITPQTRIMLLRDVLERAKQLAPYLRYDSDPYPVVTDGKIVWVVDAFTTTNKYPYSQSTSGTGGLSNEFNYVRNSVKVTIDAYEGTVNFYVIDPSDPIIQAYQKAFPGLFQSGDDVPAEIEDHFRYPEELFTVQAEVFGSYHVTDITRFYQQNAKWLRSPDPNSGRLDPTGAAVDAADAATAANDATSEPQAASSTSRRMDPYYLLLRLPGDTEQHFVNLQPMVPVSEDNAQTRLVSFLVARSDPGQYGKLQVFTMPDGETVLGPSQVDNEINTTPSIAERFTLLDRSGSSVLQGSLQLIPVGDSIVYVRPIYVQGQGRSSFPKFSFVVAFAQGREPILAETVAEGVAALFEADLPGVTPPDDGDPPPDQQTVDELLQQASDTYARAEEARNNGDLGEYQRLVTEVGDLIAQALGIEDAGSVTITTPTTAPSG